MFADNYLNISLFYFYLHNLWLCRLMGRL